MTMPTHIMGQLAEVNRALGRIEGTLAAVADDLKGGSTRMDAHDKRIGKIENGNHRAAGFSAGVGAVFGAAIGLVAQKLGWPLPHS
jgi:hypothetical protein